MASGLYLSAYLRERPSGVPDSGSRFPAVFAYTLQVETAGGSMSSAVEILGDRCLVRVRGVEEALLALIAADEFLLRIPADNLDTTVGDLTPAQRRRISDELSRGWVTDPADSTRVVVAEDAGYPVAEIRERLGNNLNGVTLRQVIRFLATRRRATRWTGGARANGKSQGPPRGHADGRMVDDGPATSAESTAGVED